MGVRVRLHKGEWYVFINHLTKRRAKKVGPGEAGKRRADELADRIRVRLAFGEDIEVKPRIKMFADYADLWLNHIKTLQKIGTWEVYNRHMQNVWIPNLKTLRIDQITRSHIKRILIDTQQQQQYSQRYMASILTSIQSCLAAAMDEEIISQNPAIGQAKHISKSAEKDMELFTEDEVRSILNTAKDYSSLLYIQVLILARTGMREGEMLTLEVGDINFKNNQIHVKRTWGNRNTKKHLQCINLPKSGKFRWVDMSPQLKDVLAGYLLSVTGAWLFPGGNGDALPMTPNGLAYHWGRLLKRAEVKHRGPHALRHTYASLLLSLGESPLYVRDQLGHTSTKITLDAYGHYLPRRGPMGAARLDDDAKRNPCATQDFTPDEYS